MSLFSAQDSVLAELREQTKWLRFLALQELRPALVELLPSRPERAAYDASNGMLTSREVALAASVSQPTVSRWWNKWAARGLGTVDDRGRFRHLTELSAVGMDKEGPGNE